MKRFILNLQVLSCYLTACRDKPFINKQQSSTLFSVGEGEGEGEGVGEGEGEGEGSLGRVRVRVRGPWAG